MRLPIYLDNHSTTRVDPRVVDSMLPFFGEDYGNAASHHHVFGWRAEAAVEIARERLAAAIGAPDPSEIVFTNVAGEIDLAELSKIGESLDIPGLEDLGQEGP